MFAFAITLLALTIRIPHPTDADADSGLLTLLTQQWRSYLVYVLSFFVVGINWANHRVMFSNFARSDHVLVWLNMLFLMIGVAFMPIPTAVLGEWLGNPDNQVTAALFYGGVATLGGLAYNLVWWYGAYVARLTVPGLSTRERHAHTVAWAPAPFLVAALTALALVNTTLAVVGVVIVEALYILPTPRLISLLKRRRARAVLAQEEVLEPPSGNP